MLAALSFLLTTNLSDPPFGDVLGALQALARTTGCLVLLTPLAKASLPPRVVAALDEPPQAQQSPRSPISLQVITLSLAGRGGGSGSGAGLSLRNLVCLRAFTAAAMFLAWVDTVLFAATVTAL